jgi:uncharacterized protein YajQ (UPF0234 family)
MGWPGGGPTGEGEMTDREEWRIKQLEEELRHEVAMRELQGQRLDTHDTSIAAVNATLAVVATRLDQLAAIQTQTAKMLQDLIQAITRDHSNGKG